MPTKPERVLVIFFLDEDREQMQHQGESYHLCLRVDWRFL